MLSWGRLRRVLQPMVIKYWLNGRSQRNVRTRAEGFSLDVFPGVFHPRYFGSSAILARYVGALDLRDKAFLEVGCGSGIVSMCASRAGANVSAVDINPDAVRCTLANAERHHVKIDAHVSDLFSSLGRRQFNVIAWNPPFLSGVPATPAEAAFYGGPDFDVIRRFAADVRRHLLPQGSVYTILSSDIDIHAIEQLFADQNFSVSRVRSRRWGLGETMVILCCR